MRKVLNLQIIFILLLVFLITACGVKEEKEINDVSQGEVQEQKNTDGVNEETQMQETLKVYTTIFPLMDFTKKIGGDYVEVSNIVPVGADAHTFEPSPRTMIDISNGDLYIYNGAGIEGFAETVAETLKTGSIKILKASDGIELLGFTSEHSHGHDDHDDHDYDEHHNHDHGEEDPHVWLDPLRAIELAENVKNALVELMPEAAKEFENNFILVKKQLQSLDQMFTEMVADITKDTIVVSHAGYGYWEKRYGIKQLGISGVSPTNEPSIQQLTTVIEFVREQGINYILFEQNISTNVAETVRAQVNAEALWLHNLEALTAQDTAQDEDYFSLMERNIEVLRKALQ